MASLPFPFPFSLSLHGASGPTQISTARAASRQAREESRPSAWWTSSPKEAGRAMGQGSWAKVGFPRSDDEGGAGAESWSVLLQTHPTLQRAAETGATPAQGLESFFSTTPCLQTRLPGTNKPSGWLGPFSRRQSLHRHPHHSTTSTTHPHSHTDRSRPSHVLSDSRHVSSSTPRWLPSSS